MASRGHCKPVPRLLIGQRLHTKRGKLRRGEAVGTHLHVYLCSRAVTPVNLSSCAVVQNICPRGKVDPKVEEL